MVDDLKRKRPEDPTKINVNQDWELDYWSKELKISKDKLKKIVDRVGPSVKKVKDCL